MATKDVMDLNRINIWTNALYSLAQALHIAKAIKFGNLPLIDDNLADAKHWITPSCSYSTSIVVPTRQRKKVTFRRDPNSNFESIVITTTSMLVQDLVVIFDSLLADVLKSQNKVNSGYPQSKVEQLKSQIKPEFIWSTNGCYELIAVRNCIVHNNSKWNARSLKLIKGIVNPLPASGDTVFVGFPMLFLYRKAVRTFLNQVDQSGK